MKNIKFLTGLFFLSIASFLFAQDYYMASPVGFGRNATGGGNATVVSVDTHDELKNALKANGSSIIIVTKDIEFGENTMISEVVTNKTLLGLKGVRLVSTSRLKSSGILGLKEGSNNIIIRNLIFEGQGAFDVDGQDLLQNTGCTNLWVDHCEFYDGVDGNFDNTKKADNITISWCKFGYNHPSQVEGMTGDGSGEHRYSNLVGGSSSDAPADGHYSITFQYCYWGNGCAQRMPRARNAELHILNCYYNVTDVSSALAIGLGAGSKGTTCYVEGTNFKKIGRVVDTSYDKTDKMVAVNFVNCLNGAANSGTVSQPSYSYTALDANLVEAAVTSACGAGATLDVSLDGKISSPCELQSALTVPENVTATSTSNSVTISWDAVAEPTGYKVKLCYDNNNEPEEAEDVSKEWDFSEWTIDGNDADGHLVLDENNASRFNYKPETSGEELTFADGTAIPDVEGLKFTAGKDTKLRLGFATGLLYLNGGSIKVEIPCSIGNNITIRGTSGNADATNRGFSVSGATINSTASSSNILGGMLTEAGGNGVWSYIATANAVAISTVNGGMNISKISVSSGQAPTVTVCEEYTVPETETTKTIEGLTEGTKYIYQVKAVRNALETAYSEAQSIVAQNMNTVNDALVKNTCFVFQNGDLLIVNGAEANEMNLYNLAGNKIATEFASQTMNIGAYPKGFYLLEVIDENGFSRTSKIILK